MQSRGNVAFNLVLSSDAASDLVDQWLPGNQRWVEKWDDDRMSKGVFPYDDKEICILA